MVKNEHNGRSQKLAAGIAWLLLELGTFSRKLFSILFGRTEQGSRPVEAESLRESGWCQDLASVQGAWGQAGVRFSLGGVVSLSLSFFLPLVLFLQHFLFVCLLAACWLAGLLACLFVCLFLRFNFYIILIFFLFVSFCFASCFLSFLALHCWSFFPFPLSVFPGFASFAHLVARLLTSLFASIFFFSS